jgi:hypothetical protein
VIGCEPEPGIIVDSSSTKESNMKPNPKVLISALAVAATAATMLVTPAAAQPYGMYGAYGAYGPGGYRMHQSVDGPLYWNHHQYNGTGTIPDVNRDPHDDR